MRHHEWNLHYGHKRAIVSFTIPEWGNLPDRVQVTSVLETSTKELLAGTKDHGLFRLNRKNKRFESLSLYDNSTGKPITKSFMSIFEDRSGVLWLGTSDAGIAKIKLRAKRSEHCT
jgi:ligand-binding sensor domain-containing protein